MIYIIEDDHQVRKALELVIQSHGYDCKSFDRGEGFLLDSTFKKATDILILDMNMAGLYGRDFLKKLNEAKNPVTIIGITAHDESAIRAYCRECGVKALLTKPVDSKALMDLIKYHGEMLKA